MKTEYPDDSPYPSFLVLGFVNSRVLHVIVARNPESNDCYVITAYPPNPDQWQPDFEKRK
ncbi:MAG: DUF4258 domain-containing protein [Gammaproteobacteria bacterium]|nr:DUF4258 domain-containing protein [Gammaproteobacteria bacterium]